MSENKGNKGDKTSFWKLLEDYRVEVPIIQRDYAQGRVGKEFLRTKFLEDLKKALDNKGELVLDFVYGSQEGETIRPLDGQQRLTTLWLLHWYIALRAGQLTKENCEVLKRFTYETRISSREFCENLCEPENFESFDGEGIVDFIEKQTWFYSAWKQDPTIQSMLRMLSGTEGGDDGIERVFEVDKCKGYWGKLTTKEPVVFYYLPLENFGLSDDLYVKMNARGKPLTPFENFKADLITYLRKEENIELYESISAKLDNIWTDIFWENKSDENKIDEIYFAFLNRFFWNEFFIARKEKRSDDEGPYRFHINEYESEPKVPYPYVLRVGKGTFRDDNGKEVETGTIENHNSSYAYLEGSEKGEVEYSDLEPYKFLHKGIPITLFKNLQKVLDNYSKHKDRYKKILGNSDSGILSRRIEDFKFIPEYKDETSITKVDNKAQRVIFFALCKYFYEYKEEENKEAENMLRWLRLVCKLTGKNEGGNAIVDSNLDARGAIRYLALLDSQNVLESLFAQSTVKADSALKRQWNEEVIKAKQILSEDGKTPRKYNGTLLKGKDGSKYKTWEEVIMDAEEYAFFDGTIRFLYQGEDGEDGEEDWDYFDKKWENAKNYFKGDVKGENTGGNYNSCLNNNDDQDEMKLLKALISKLDDKQFLAALFHSYRAFNNRSGSWRHYLLHPDLCAPIHELLLGNDDIENPPVCDYVQEEESYKGPLPLSTIKDILYLLSQTKLLNYIAENIPDAWIRDGYHHNHCAIYRQKGGGVFLNAKGRDSFFKKNATKIKLFNEDIIIDDIKGRYLLSVPNVYFDYFNDKGEKVGHFLWYEDEYIYLQDPDGKGDDPSLVKNADAPEESPEHWYCVPTKSSEGEDLSDNEILKSLDELKRDYEKANPPSNS